MAEVGQPTQNGYAERVIRTIKEEEIDLSDYQDYNEARQQITKFLEEVYNKKTNSLGLRLFNSDRIRKSVEQTKQSKSQSSLTKAFFVSQN